MRALVQRVTSSSVVIDGAVHGKIGPGLTVLLGITHTDTMEDVEFLADKCINLRIFKDENDKMNLSLRDIQGGMLIISQFTLYGDASHGRRPSFTEAARPEQAIPLYEAFIKAVRDAGIPAETGIFGADMKLEIHNDGPVTILIESRKKSEGKQ